MKEFIRLVKRLFGKYEAGYEYWVNNKDINIPAYYKKTRVREEKWKRKMKYWLRTGEFESVILLDKNFNLVDGYSSVKIAYLKGVDKVPVYFVN